MNSKKPKLNFMQMILLVGYTPLLIASIVLTIFASYQLRHNLEESVYSKLRSCAISVEQYFLWDIAEGILCKDEVSYEFIDSLKSEDVDLTFFNQNVRYLTSVLDDSGNRIEDTKADDAIWEFVKRGNEYKADNVVIGDSEYYVYYVPVLDENENVIGMGFAGEKNGNSK